jgi:hypothetical protein
MRTRWPLAALAATALLAGACTESPPPSSTVAASLPEGALIATTALRDPAADVDDVGVPGPIGPVDQSCPPFVPRPAARMDICYEVIRIAAGAAWDRYLARVYGSIDGQDGSGLSAWLIRVRPTGDVVPTIVATWPRGVVSGPCREMFPDLALVGMTAMAEDICGTTTVAVGPPVGIAGETVMTWQCPDCPPPRRATLGVILLVVAEVPDGAVPTWEIRAEVGG